MKAPISLLAVLLMLSSASLAQTAPARETAPNQQAVPTASTSSTEAAAASAGEVPAAPSAPLFAPGAKVFLEPMNGFEQFLSRTFVKKKVPVVLVSERAQADFVMSGEAHVKKPNWIKATLFATTHGKGEISVKDARTGNQVFAYDFHRVDQMTADAEIYQIWADACAKHLKKAMEKK